MTLIENSLVRMSLQGGAELQAALLKLPQEIQKRELDDAFKVGAQLIADQVADNLRAQGRDKIAEAVMVAKPSARQLRASGRAVVWVVAFKKPFSRLVHLLEYGTAERTQHKHPRRTGKVTARPFFRPALDIRGAEAVRVIIARLTKNIETMAAQLGRDAARNRRK